MKDCYSKYAADYDWQITEDGWVRSLQGVREAQLALGNGFLGSRSVLEELPYDSKAGTFVAGLYDSIGSQVAELVNWPNPFNFKITARGEKSGVATMDVLSHKRILNMKHGLLLRRTVFQDSKKRKYDYQSLRFLSMDNLNLGVLQIVFTPLDEGGEFSIETGIDSSVYNAGTVTEGRKKHFRVRELGQFRNEGYLMAETFEKLHTVIFRSGFYYETKGKKIPAKDNVFELKLEKSQRIVFTKVFHIDTISQGQDSSSVKDLSERKFRKAFRSSFNSLVKRHIDVWEGLWDKAGVSIWGDPEVEKNFRFNIYHMLICAPKDNGLSSIGAKALTGEGYRGHIFWDTEIFLLPFYLYAFPEIARNILLYRHRRIGAAKKNAESLGYKGAMFPWESAGTGIDETPEWARDLDGKVIKIHTGQMEHHISADIAYAFYYYYNLTHDEKFMLDYGYEVIFETARFWASRVEYSRKKRRYRIKDVIGPDEFHTDIDDNAFTNMMARWNLRTAVKCFAKIRKAGHVSAKAVIGKLGVSSKEAGEWKSIASRIAFNRDKKGVIEQFDGYFKKKYIKIREWDENYLPALPKELTPRDYADTQFVKQADVIMLFYLFPEAFNSKTKKENYNYYIERTLHKSSLSLPVYALAAIEAGDMSRACRFFNISLHSDISNIYSNTDHGVHAAGIGGTWQVLINGFAGVRVIRDELSLSPRLPHHWRKIIFSMYWRGCFLRLEVKNTKVRIKLLSPVKEEFRVKVFGVFQEIGARRTYEFKRKRLAGAKEESYYL